MIKFGSLVSDVAGGELGFHLGEPDLGVRGQKGGILMATGETTGAARGYLTAVGCCSAMSGSPM